MEKLNLRLVGVDGNAFFLLGAFVKQAKKENWSEEDIDKIINEAKSKDYKHLLSTLSSYCRNSGF